MPGWSPQDGHPTQGGSARLVSYRLNCSETSIQGEYFSYLDLVRENIWTKEKKDEMKK